MSTSIQVSDELQKELMNRKFIDKETYEEVIWNLIEDTLELSEETKREIEEARAEVKAGKYHTMAQVKKELKL